MRGERIDSCLDRIMANRRSRALHDFIDTVPSPKHLLEPKSLHSLDAGAQIAQTTTPQDIQYTKSLGTGVVEEAMFGEGASLGLYWRVCRRGGCVFSRFFDFFVCGLLLHFMLQFTLAIYIDIRVRLAKLPLRQLM